MDLPQAEWTVRSTQGDSARAPKSIYQANQLVRSTFRSENESAYPFASDVYLQLITQPLGVLSGRERAIVRCHHRQLALILPDTLRQRIEQLNGGAAHLYEDLRIWWRAQDPLPATTRNERLEKHLGRVAHAAQQYRDTQDSVGVDARGRVFIRLGSPARTTSVRFNASRVLTLIRESTVLTRGDFPDNEYWIYPHIDEHAKYLFVEKGGAWEVGIVQDLIPSFMRTGLGANPRGRNRAQMMGVLLEEIYSQLGTIDVDYGPWYQEAESATAFTVSGSRPGPTRMRQVVIESRESERQFAADRKEAVPNAFSEVAQDDEQLPVAARVARFLDADGTTHAEVYWGLPEEALQVADRTQHADADQWDDQLLVFAAVHHAPDFERRAIHYNRYFLRGGDSEGRVKPQSYTISTVSEADHLRLQWQHHFARRTSHSGLDVGPRLKVQAMRFDSLRALNSDPGTLEMSDLKPMVAVEEADASIVEQTDDAILYPFSEISVDASLLLYFEVYHLALGQSHRTQYTVEYEVRRQTEQRGLRRLFGDRTKEQKTITATTYDGTERNVEEYILIDLSKEGSAGPLRVTVRVTDEVTGQQVERHINFTIGAGTTAGR